MVLNRFDQVPTLDVVPNTDGGVFHFYDCQIVTFTATLQVPGGVADGTTICFYRIGDASGKGDPALDFSAYPSGAEKTDTTYNEKLNAYEVVARSTDQDKSVAKATIVALYLPIKSESPPSFRVEANISCTPVFDRPYSRGKTRSNLPTEMNTFQLLPASNVGETPSTCQGNYFRWQGYVASAGDDVYPGTPLRNICVRLTAMADHSFDGVRFFPAYALAQALVVSMDEHGGPYVDLVTAEDGVASVFVCAKNTSGTYAGTLRANTGDLGQLIFNYVLPDFLEGVNTRLQGPTVGSPLKLNPDNGESLQCLIPSYDSAAKYDSLFLLCNRRMQQVDGSSVQQRLDTSPVAMSFSKFGLHNEAYSYDHNELAYVVLPLHEPAQLSRSSGFLVTGDPGHVTLDEVGIAPAPKLVSGLAPNGLVMNVASTVDGMTVAVPVGEQNNPFVSGWGDQPLELSVTAMLVGWMDNAEELKIDELTSALPREITPAEISAGYAYVWFPRIFLWGLGQSPTGSMGRCSIQYEIRPTHFGVSTLSEMLVSHIDTLPPTGVGEYFETN